ncbi:ornithine cyclodeaminase family protein [Yinghuangia soli]|uniref:Ornithine cyclodeaminase family protein n=1 Tax=Yinghuangia soli TaxID=2908204 RepID=A0AA41TZF8_9ACTN|nr:ornithine cyclodeaminase family protein [Yinghuangia soli]MCF2527235.1 ornithine cyclodeaminase family protein [Yinghuangia soli]
MTLFLTRTEVLDLMDMGRMIDAVSRAHADAAQGRAVNPGPHGIVMPGSETVFLPMTAASAPLRGAAVKLLADMPANRARGLPAQRSTVMVVDPETGACEAVLDGRALTLFRTAAASAVATRHLARPDSRVLGLIGAGALAATHVEALRAVLPLAEVRVWSRTAATAAACAEGITATGLEARVVDDPRDAVEGVDVLCTLTPSREPLVRGAWFRPGLHVNAVGAPPRADHREIDTEGVRRARVVVDNRETARLDSGDVMIPVAEGAIDPAHFADELGEIIVGAKPGREKPDEITLFNSVGIGLQDLAAARLVIDRARQLGIGFDIDLSR